VLVSKLWKIVAVDREACACPSPVPTAVVDNLSNIHHLRLPPSFYLSLPPNLFFPPTTLQLQYEAISLPNLSAYNHIFYSPRRLSVSPAPAPRFPDKTFGARASTVQLLVYALFIQSGVICTLSVALNLLCSALGHVHLNQNGNSVIAFSVVPETAAALVLKPLKPLKPSPIDSTRF